MNQEDYVTYPSAKLLRQAGFPQQYNLSYGNAFIATDDGPLCRPSLWDAMKWLRKIEYLHVRASYNLGGDEGWVSIVYDLDKKIPIDQPSLYDIRLDKSGVARAISRLYPTCEDACDAGIAAACEWLLKT